MIKPVIKDITITQSDDVKIRYRLKQDETIVDISLYDFQGQIRKLSDNSLVYQVTIDKTELASNIVYYTIPSATTAILEPNTQYVYGYVWKDSSSKIFHFKSGELIVLKKVAAWV